MIKARSGDFLVIRLKEGERLPQALVELGLSSAVVLAGIGMLRELSFGYWNGERYLEEKVPEPVELLSLQGNLGEKETGEPIAHLHLVVGKEGGKALGGHLMAAVVHNTAELVLAQLPGVRLLRKEEPTGLFGLYPEER
jgi:hypothetical protein